MEEMAEFEDIKELGIFGESDIMREKENEIQDAKMLEIKNEYLDLRNKLTVSEKNSEKGPWFESALQKVKREFLQLLEKKKYTTKR